MLKRIVIFYKTIAMLSFIGTFFIMSDSLIPLTIFAMGMFSTLLWLSFAVIVTEVHNYLEYQKKAIKWLVKSERDGR